jgi:hypothetical protein
VTQAAPTSGDQGSVPLYPGPSTYPGPTTYPGRTAAVTVGPIPPAPVPGDDGAPQPYTPPPRMREWSLFARTPDYSLNGGLPLSGASIIRRHLGVDTAVVTTPYSPAAFDKLQPSCGIELWRDGRQEFTGLVDELNPSWDVESGQAVIKVQCVGDMVHLADRLAFPDPGDEADDQVINDYWAFTGLASSAMQRLIDDQAGPRAHPDRRVRGLVIGADPGLGTSRTWTALFPSVLEQLTLMSVASGANLGVRMRASTGRLTADIVAPQNLADSIKFSADMSNLSGFDWRISAPTVTRALAAGQGDLHARMRRMAASTDPLATQWGRQIWTYIDRRDTEDPAELITAAQDALADGGPTVSLAVTLQDSEAATYGRDWNIGDRITVYVGLPGQRKPGTVSDVVREIRFDVDNKGAETIRPAIGSFDAKATVPTPTQQQLARVGRSLRGLIART